MIDVNLLYTEKTISKTQRTPPTFSKAAHRAAATRSCRLTEGRTAVRPSVSWSVFPQDVLGSDEAAGVGFRVENQRFRIGDVPMIANA